MSPSVRSPEIAVIRLRGAVALLGAFPALAGVDLCIGRGELVLVAGPNGAGKSTLLRLCAGLVPISAGMAEVLGCDLADDRRAVRRRVGMLSHETALYDELTVLDNVRFWARAAGAPAADAEAACERVDVESRLWGVAVAHLSAGQRRRTSLASMIVRRPELWLLDEPHAGLDKRARDLLDELIAEAVASGATALIASHELERVEGLATRTVTLTGGIVSADTAGGSDGLAGGSDGLAGGDAPCSSTSVQGARHCVG